MMPPDITLRVAIESIAGALLVGVLIGAQREEAGGDCHPGLRDFIPIALTGGVCGLLGNPWLAAAALLSIVILLAVYHVENRANRTGITTELAAVATFGLALLAGS